MSGKEVYSSLSGYIMSLWLLLHITSFYDVYKIYPSYLLFRKWKYNNINRIYEYIFFKMYEEKDVNFITKIKVKLNTYIDFYKSNNKSLVNNILTIIITSVVTVTVTQYTLQGQANQADKEFITKIINKLNDDYMFVFCWVIILYGIIGILNVFKNIKFEYYLMVKNIIDEVEKKTKDETEKEENKQLTLEIKEIQNILKSNNEDKIIIKKACNKIINEIF